MRGIPTKNTIQYIQYSLGLLFNLIFFRCMACLTAYIIYFCAETHYEKCLKKVSRFVHEQNEQVGEVKEKY